jgi:uncharacterized protein YjbI with pentapeptide repeats
LLKQGVAGWNAWRDENANIRPDLSGADLIEANLGGVNLTSANLSRADLRKANLRAADLSRADLGGAILIGTDLHEANLREVDLFGAGLAEATLFGMDLRGANLKSAILVLADLRQANLSGAELDEADLRAANLGKANLSRASLIGADLSQAILIETDLREANLREANFNRADLTEANLLGADLECSIMLHANLTGANLTGCRVHGVSAWGLKLDRAKQENLVITEADPAITVDNIEVAQFIYLMLHNQKIRDVIDTITSKAVLILGRFTAERKAVLDALREELRHRNYLPIMFDFDKPTSQTTDETITLLARMSRFVIADISDAKSVLQELRAIVPDLPSVPVQPIILEMQHEPGMFDFYRNRPSFLPVHRYVSQEQLLADLGEKVIRPAELKVLDLRAST